jgi:predicted ATPase
MITTLEIENFKCFASLRLRLGALTLLTGYNAGGKSTAIQPLLLLAQAARVRLFTDHLKLNGPMVRLGTAGDVLPASASPSSLAFKVADKDFELSWRATGRAGERQISVTESNWPVPGMDEAPRADSTNATHGYLSIAIAGLSYLSAMRIGPEDAYPTPESFEDSPADVGVDGRFAPYWYRRCVDNEVPVARRHPQEPATSFRKQFDAWFSTLFPNAQADVQHNQQLALQGLQFRISEFGDWRRPANVGYGFSYAFPVLVALLAAEDGQVVVIDSPEAHLHPFAQSQMGRMIAHFAASGVQVIVETHSDHLLSGVRLAVKDNVLPPDDLRLHFFTGATEEGHGVLSLDIDREGRIASWPEGFFDQSEKDLARLSGWE